MNNKTYYSSSGGRKMIKHVSFCSNCEYKHLLTSNVKKLYSLNVGWVCPKCGKVNTVQEEIIEVK